MFQSLVSRRWYAAQRCLLALLVLGALWWFTPPVAEAQEPPTFGCRWRDGAYYQPHLFPRVEPQNRRMVLVDYRTGEVVQVLPGYEDGLELILTRFGQHRGTWSSDCRFLAGTVPAGNGYRDLLLWDIPNGGSLYHRFTGLPLRDSRGWVRWDASASFALVQAERSTWALDVANKAQIKVLSDACGFGDVHFDPARRQLIAVKHSPPPGSTWCTEGEQAITFFDLNTGAETRRVEFPNVERPIRFVASSDGRTLAVRDVPNGFAVYESFLVLVSGETGAITEINDGPSAVGVVRFSPDGRYMALAYVFYVRVWDVWNLPSAVEDRRPLYFLKLHDGEGWWDYRFASNTVIEIGVRGGLTRRFDLSTGQYVN